MKRYRRAVTLLEVLIAMALTVLILTVLTFFYSHVSKIGTEIDQIKDQGFYVRYLESRLADILPKVVTPTDPDFAFFSVGDEGLTKPGSQSLIFTFNNGPSLDKDLSNHVIGRIYVDRDGNLMFSYWPTLKHWNRAGLPEERKELLLEKVDSLSFEFFVAPEKSKRWSPSKGQEIEPKGEWRRQPWLKEFQNVPVIIKVIIFLSEEKNIPEAFLTKVEGKKAVVFMFPIMNKKTPHIVYE